MINCFKSRIISSKSCSWRLKLADGSCSKKKRAPFTLLPEIPVCCYYIPGETYKLLSFIAPYCPGISFDLLLSLGIHSVALWSSQVTFHRSRLEVPVLLSQTFPLDLKQHFRGVIRARKHFWCFHLSVAQ